MPYRLVILIVAFLSFTCRADKWVHHLPFGGVDNIAETSGRVYFSSLGALYAYDKKNRETITFSPKDYLNDIGVSGIYTNPSSDMCAVAYASGNIDIIRDNSSILNLPDIKTSRLTPRDISDIVISPDLKTMHVTTGFGVVVFDLVKGEVREHIRSHDTTTTVTRQPIDIPQSLGASCFSAAKGLSNVWIGNSSGISCYDLTSDVPVLTAGPIRPGEMSVSDINMLHFSDSGNLYIGSRGNSNVHINRNTGNIGRLCRLETDGTFRDLTPGSLTHLFEKKPYPSDSLFDLTFVREDPANPAIHYAGSLLEGFYALDCKEEINHFYLDNTRFLDNWGVRVMDLAFDPRGGMWAYSEAPEDTPMIFYLPPLARENIGAVTSRDWTPVDFTAGVISGRDCTAVMSASGRYIYSMGSADIYIYDTAGTSTLADDRGHWARTFVDASTAASLPVTRLCSIMEDAADNSLWIGTDIGILIAPRPWESAEGTLQVIRPKVDRNDGTSLADYLLANERIYGIAADPLGNKWIATESSGAVHVSPDGSRILAVCTSANSPLPSDRINAVACAPDGTVYFGTDYGLIEYQSDYRPGESDYSNISIYPNPVRPDYHGDIIIDGFVANSVINIIDSAGALVARLRSEGGRIRWNPADASRRLPSGIYYVIADSPECSGRTIGKIALVR